MLNKTFTLKQLLMSLAVVACIFLGVFAGSCDSQTSASYQNTTAAGQKWGTSPNMTNYYEYQQMMQIYEARDNPKLVLNAYLYDNMTNSLTCLGRVKGFGIPYGTELSPPQDGTQSVPEPNGLYPSQNTSADWVLLIGPDGKTHLTFVEPSLVITDLTLPCKPMGS